MAKKGKEVADKASSGKRNRGGAAGDDDKTGGGRKRKNPGVLQFFEDSAAEFGESDSDFGDFGDDFLDEDFETEPGIKNDLGKAQNLPFIPKEEELNEEEFDRMLEERYKSGSSLFTFPEYENKRSIERNSIQHYAKDPIIWKVKCVVGRERHSAFCLMQKFVDLQSLGTKLQIISAFSVDHIKGFIYIEAEKQCDVNEACKGLCSIYPTRIASVPQNEVSHLLSIRNEHKEVLAGTWTRVKNGKYKGDLAQIVAVNNARKRATVKLIPRIDLMAMAGKYGGGVAAKKTSIPAPRLISSSELEEFRPLIQVRRDRETGKLFEFLDGLMFKDGYLYKKVSLDSLNCWGVIPSEEELLKFQPSESNESDDLEWLSKLYGNQKKKQIILCDGGGGKGEGASGLDKGSGKGEGSSGVIKKGGGKGEGSTGLKRGGGKGESSSGLDKGGGKGQGSSGLDKGSGKGDGSSGSSVVNGFELHDLVCFGRKDFGVILGVEKDDSYKILKDSPEGPNVVTVQLKDLKSVFFGTKFTTVDQHKKAISFNDTVKVLEGPSKGKQGLVKYIYRHIIFAFDENEVENGGYFCFKSQMCEKIKFSYDAQNDEGGEIGTSGFEDFPSSPKSPLSPEKPWEARENRPDFNRGDRDGMFSIGQSLRIRIGPLKGYLCRVVAIHRTDVTVKLDSQQRVLTVKNEHLSEVRGKSSTTSMSEDPESTSLKPFDILGPQDSSKDWIGGAGSSGGSDRWTAGGLSSERSSWPSFPASGFGAGSSSSDPSEGKDGEKAEGTPWESKVVAKEKPSWGAVIASDTAVATGDQAGGWEKSDSWGKPTAKTSFDGGVSNTWGKATAPSGDPGQSSKDEVDTWGRKGKSKVDGSAGFSHDASASWEKKSSGYDNQDDGRTSNDPWNQAKNVTGNNASRWGAATSGKNQFDSSDKGKDGDSGSWVNNKNSGVSDCSWNNVNSQNTQKSWGNVGSTWDKSMPTQEKGAWGKASEDKWSGKEGSSAGKGQWNSSPAVENQSVGWGDAGGSSSQPESDNIEGGSKWNTGSRDAGENQDSNWGKKNNVSESGESNGGGKSNWNSGSGNSGENKDSKWGRKNDNSESSGMGGNQESEWGKKNSENSGTGDSNWGGKSKWNSGSNDSGENPDSSWGRTSNWNLRNDLSADQSTGDQTENFGNRGSRGGFRGRGGFGGRNGEGSSCGRGRSDIGVNGGGGRGRSNDGGGWDNDSNEDKPSGWSSEANNNEGWSGSGGGFGGRFGCRGGSDRGGFRGRGRGRRDQGGWNNDSSEDKPSWSSEANNNESWKNNSGSGGGFGGGFGGRGGFRVRGRGRRDQGGWNNDFSEDNKPSWSSGANNNEGWKNNSSSGEGFGGRGDSDRGGFRGSGRGSRGHNGSWNNDSNEDKPLSWSSEANNNEEWKNNSDSGDWKKSRQSWNSGSGGWKSDPSEDKPSGRNGLDSSNKGWDNDNGSGSWSQSGRKNKQNWTTGSGGWNNNPDEAKTSSWSEPNDNKRLKSSSGSGSWNQGGDGKSQLKNWNSGTGGGWNKNEGEDKPSDWSKEANDNTVPKSNNDLGSWNQKGKGESQIKNWNSGSGTSNQSGGWGSGSSKLTGTSHGGGWNKNAGEDKPSGWSKEENNNTVPKSNNDFGSWNQKGEGESQMKNWNSGSGTSNQSGGWGSGSSKLTGTSHGGGWNKNAGEVKPSGWSKEANDNTVPKSNNDLGSWNQKGKGESQMKNWNSGSGTSTQSGGWGSGSSKLTGTSNGDGWNKNAGEDKPSGWSKEANGNTLPKSNCDLGSCNQKGEGESQMKNWNSGSGTSNQSGGWGSGLSKLTKTSHGGGWNKNAGEDKPSGWSKEANDNTVPKSNNDLGSWNQKGEEESQMYNWNSGSGTSNQSGGWGSGSSKLTGTSHASAAESSKQTHSTNDASGSLGNNSKWLEPFGGSIQSTITETKERSDQQSDWNKGSSTSVDGGSSDT